MKKKLQIFITALALLFVSQPVMAQAPNLGTAAKFVLFSSNGAVTNSGISHITGNVGTHNGSNTGFGNVNGVMNNANVATSEASADLLAAYNQLNGTAANFFPSNLLGNGDTLVAGVYSIGSAAVLNGTLTLNGKGNTDAVFIFKINGAFSTSANAKVILINGAKACNIFWKTEGLVSLATGTTIRGTVIANNAAINMNSGDTLEGRALSTTGAVIVNGTFAYTPIGCGSPTLSGPVPPYLMSTEGFALYTSNGQVANTGITRVNNGDIGTNSGTVSGFDSALVDGMIHPGPDTSTARADSELVKVYTYIDLLTHDIELLYPAQFGNNLVLTPHTYLLNAATVLTDTLYLNAQGNAAAVFVIRINGTLTTSAKSRVILINGTQAQNVYWRIDGATILNDSSVFQGTTLVNNGTLNSGSVLYGRMLATIGALSTNNARINNLDTAMIIPDLIVSTTTGVQGTYRNVTVTSTGNGTLTGNLIVLGSMTVQTGGRLNTADNLVQGNNAFTLSTGATLGINASAGIALTGQTGAIQVAGTRSYSTGATYIYSGNSIQQTGTGLPPSVDSLVINNVNGVALSATQTVNRKLTLGNGNLNTGIYDLTLQPAAIISGASANGYVGTHDTAALSGVLRRTVSTSGGTVLFPVGNSRFRGSYTPASITMSGGTTDIISVSVFSGVRKNGFTGADVTTHAVNKTWIISEAVAGGSNVSVQLQWNDSMELPSFIRSSTGISHHNGISWNMPASASYTAASGSNPYTAIRTGITSFSLFVVGDSVSGSTLPVKLISFTGKFVNNETLLNWKTTSEINNNHFSIERSADGIIYEEIGSLNGAGTSAVARSYNYTDEHIRDISDLVLYYRLKQVDHNGEASVYGPVVITKNMVTGNAINITAFPNPVKDAIHLQVVNHDGGNIHISLYNMQGDIVAEQVNVAGQGTSEMQMNNLSGLKPGMYYLQATMNGITYRQKFLKAAF